MLIFAVLAHVLFIITPIFIFSIEATAIFIFSFFIFILPILIFAFRDEVATIALSFVFRLEVFPLFIFTEQLSGVRATPFIFFLSRLFEAIFSELSLRVSVFLAPAVFFPANLSISLLFAI